MKVPILGIHFTNLVVKHFFISCDRLNLDEGLVTQISTELNFYFQMKKLKHLLHYCSCIRMSKSLNRTMPVCLYTIDSTPIRILLLLVVIIFTE